MLNKQRLTLNPFLPWIGKSSPIRELVKLRRGPMDFRFHVWGAHISKDKEDVLPEASDRFVACGISEEDNFASIAACAEALERYVFAIINEILDTLPLLEPDVSLVSEALLFDLPFLLPKKISRSTWCKQAMGLRRRILPCWKLSEGGKLVETQIPVEFLTSEGKVNLFQTTNGMACGLSLQGAINRGLKEVVERDALMLVWLYQVKGTLIPPESVLPEHYSTQVYRMGHQGITTIIQDISTDSGYSVILAVVAHFSTDGQPIFAFGAGADTVPYRAASHAFREACLGWKGVSWRMEMGSVRSSLQSEQDYIPRSFVEHADFYADPELISKLSFLFNPDETPKYSMESTGQTEGKDAAYSQNTIYPPKGRDVFILDLTTPEVKKMGAYVVKVIVPGLVPLYFADMGCDELAASRLPISIGGKAVTSAHALNTMPHPWP